MQARAGGCNRPGKRPRVGSARGEAGRVVISSVLSSSRMAASLQPARAGPTCVIMRPHAWRKAHRTTQGRDQGHDDQGTPRIRCHARFRARTRYRSVCRTAPREDLCGAVPSRGIRTEHHRNVVIRAGGNITLKVAATASRCTRISPRPIRSCTATRANRCACSQPGRRGSPARARSRRSSASASTRARGAADRAGRLRPLQRRERERHDRNASRRMQRRLVLRRAHTDPATPRYAPREARTSGSRAPGCAARGRPQRLEPPAEV